MNLFCRLLGHTWVYKTEDAKIRWTTAKSMNELEQTNRPERVRSWLECARCKERIDDPPHAEVVRRLA